jgi:hypothetical protein
MKKYYSNPDYRRQNLDREIQDTRLRKAKDPEFHAKLKSYLKEDFRRRTSSEAYVRKVRLNAWVRRSGWRRAEPTLEEVPTRIVYRKGLPSLLKLRPARPSRQVVVSCVDSEKFFCGICWLKLSWEEMCPEGFENAATIREFTVRTEELDFTKS